MTPCLVGSRRGRRGIVVADIVVAGDFVTISGRSCCRPLSISRREGDDRARPIVSFFDRARLAGEQGLCYVRLRRFDDAKVAFQTGLATLDASSKIRARLLTGLATTHVRQGEIEQACRTTGEALRIATRTRTALSLQQVYDVRRQLERWQDSRAVRELDEQLRLAS
jgi:tetratricopeptide (TPR) repeat protein